MNQVRDRPHSFPQPGSLAFPQPSPNPVGSPSAIPFSPRPSTACDARYQSFPTLGSTTSATSNPSPPVTYPLPTLERLKETASELNGLSSHAQLAWAEDVLRLCERHWDQCLSEPNQGGSSHTTSGIPSKLKDLLDIAVPMIITLATDPDRTLSSLASYLKAILLSSGACPDHLPKDPRQAFRDFEAAARGGEHRGWYRLAKDYELVGDIPRAKDCLDRGVRHGDCESTYVSWRARMVDPQLTTHSAFGNGIPPWSAQPSTQSRKSPHPSSLRFGHHLNRLSIPISRLRPPSLSRARTTWRHSTNSTPSPSPPFGLTESSVSATLRSP